MTLAALDLIASGVIPRHAGQLHWPVADRWRNCHPMIGGLCGSLRRQADDPWKNRASHRARFGRPYGPLRRRAHDLGEATLLVKHALTAFASDFTLLVLIIEAKPRFDISRHRELPS